MKYIAIILLAALFAMLNSVYGQSPESLLFLETAIGAWFFVSFDDLFKGDE